MAASCVAPAGSSPPTCTRQSARTPCCSTRARTIPPPAPSWRTCAATPPGSCCAPLATASRRMTFGTGDLQAICLTFKLATATTVLLLLLAAPAAWGVGQRRWRGRAPVSAVVALPLVLPPPVLGFYLLVAFG